MFVRRLERSGKVLQVFYVVSAKPGGGLAQSDMPSLLHCRREVEDTYMYASQ